MKMQNKSYQSGGFEMKIYFSKEELYNDCTEDEKDICFPLAIFSEEDGEMLGYIKEYI